MEHLGEVEQQRAALDAAHARVLAVSFAEPDMAAAYARDRAMVFPLASDAPREAYRAYGLRQGASRNVWRPSAVLQHLGLRLRGFHPGRHRQPDVLQLGGDFVILPSGRLGLSHPSVAGDDRPTIDEILRALRPTGA